MTAETASLDVLNGHKYANLTTFRKNGQGVVTPVWFARIGGQIYVVTLVDAGKTKRVRNNPRALIGPSDARGKSLGGQVPIVGRILADAEARSADQELTKKYGLFKRVFDFFMNLRGNAGKTVFLAFELQQP
jgi:PPOX class probable F420-dependent enzyme